MMGIVAVVEDKRQLALQDFVLPERGRLATFKACKRKEVISCCRECTSSPENPCLKQNAQKLSAGWKDSKPLHSCDCEDKVDRWIEVADLEELLQDVS